MDAVNVVQWISVLDIILLIFTVIVIIVFSGISPHLLQHFVLLNCHFL